MKDSLRLLSSSYPCLQVIAIHFVQQMSILLDAGQCTSGKRGRGDNDTFTGFMFLVHICSLTNDGSRSSGEKAHSLLLSILPALLSADNAGTQLPSMKVRLSRSPCYLFRNCGFSIGNELRFSLLAVVRLMGGQRIHLRRTLSTE
jgi:hypothetical protein